MHKYVIIGLLMIGAGCKPVVKLPVQEEFGWMEGTWVGTDGLFGENWTYFNSEDRLEGIGWRLENGDTIQTEIMQILNRRDKIFFMADPGKGSPVYFEINEHRQYYFRAENPFNDFPSVIEYAREEDQLNATASSNEREVNFRMILK